MPDGASKRATTDYRDTYIAQWGIVLAVARRFHLVKVVLVQLSDKTRHVAVLEVFREDRAGEFLALLRKHIVSIPSHSICARALASSGGDSSRTSTTTKVSPSFPHRATS